VSSSDQEGSTCLLKRTSLLHIACSKSHLELVTVLLEAGADVEAQDEVSLCLSVSLSFSLSLSVSVSLFVPLSLSLSVSLSVFLSFSLSLCLNCLQRGCIALLIACEKNNIPIVNLLLAYGAKIELRDEVSLWCRLIDEMIKVFRLGRSSWTMLVVEARAN
jgi:ankyrin repeat protein